MTVPLNNNLKIRRLFGSSPTIRYNGPTLGACFIIERKYSFLKLGAFL